MRFVVCFLVLPWLPGLAILIPAGHIEVVQDRIVVGVLVGVIVTVVSAALATAAGGGIGTAVSYAAATGVLSIIAFMAIVAITWTVACGIGAGTCG